MQRISNSVMICHRGDIYIILTARFGCITEKGMGRLQEPDVRSIREKQYVLSLTGPLHSRAHNSLVTCLRPLQDQVI